LADYIKSNVAEMSDSQATAYDSTSIGGNRAGIMLVEQKTQPLAKAAKGRCYAMVINLRKCVGCHACTIACKAEFNVPLGVWRSWVEIQKREIYPGIRRSFLPKLCNNCRKAPCVDVCPTRASHYDKDGTVQIDDNKCIGCKLCIAACPYKQRFINPDKGTVDKCTFCMHRVQKGLVPSCVNACISGARAFGDVNDPNSKVSKLMKANKVSVVKAELGTKPLVYYVGDANEH
jgi:tetrathionate reductase subunit B